MFISENLDSYWSIALCYFHWDRNSELWESDRERISAAKFSLSQFWERLLRSQIPVEYLTGLFAAWMKPKSFLDVLGGYCVFSSLST